MFLLIPIYLLNSLHKNSSILLYSQYGTSIRRMFLNEMNGTYLEKTTDERKVIDYIAGMTDDMFHQEIEI